jgi:molybdopterin converting factor small subunit
MFNIHQSQQGFYMTENTQEVVEQKAPSDAERNFANLRKSLEETRKEKHQLEERLQKLEQSMQKAPSYQNEEDEDEPYVNHRVLNKRLSEMYTKAKEDGKKEAKQELEQVIEQQKQEDWLRNNADFYDVMQHAQKLADKDPELADTILRLPDNFERKKLVYKTIKAQGFHKPQELPTAQDKINNNRKPVFYTPSGTSSAPYAATGDFSSAGKKAAYEKMMQLKNNLRI